MLWKRLMYNVTKYIIFNIAMLSNLPEECFKITVFTLFTLSEMGDFRFSLGEI